MNEDLNYKLKKLGLYSLCENWSMIIKTASRKKTSYKSFLLNIIDEEYQTKIERARMARLKRAKIPEMLILETFPFNKQPKLDKKIILNHYDSLDFITDNKNLIFIGPTGCGKSGLATAFLIHSINNDYNGLFVDFSKLIDSLHSARGDYTEEKIMKKLASVDVLLIDELGYIACKKEQASLLFDLLRRRHKKKTTIITTQLGFNEWDEFLKSTHVTAALLDRITSNCILFNMNKCISIRKKKIVYASIK